MDTTNENSNRNTSDTMGLAGIDSIETNKPNVNEEPIKNGEKKERDEKGRFTTEYSGGPGRPKGSISIKETIKRIFEADPDRFQQFIDSLIEKDKALIWQMLEGRPKQSIGGDEENPLRIITVDKDLAKLYDITPSTEDNSEESS